MYDCSTSLCKQKQYKLLRHWGLEPICHRPGCQLTTPHHPTPIPRVPMCPGFHPPDPSPPPHHQHEVKSAAIDTYINPLHLGVAPTPDRATFITVAGRAILVGRGSTRQRKSISRDFLRIASLSLGGSGRVWVEEEASSAKN